MPLKISDRVLGIAMSPTLRISALAAELRAAGEDVLDFSAGEPDFPTPESVKAAGRAAIDANKTRYTANAGIVDLRRGIAAMLQQERGVAYTAEEILVSPGAKASLYFAVMALFDPGDEVLIPQPYWVTYPEQVRLAGATPVYVPCSEANGFKLSADDFAAAIGPRTRGLILNYPSNPTGACYTADELRPLAELCAAKDLWIVADEIYSRLVFDGRAFTSVAALGEAARARTILIDGMSKTWSMTGWRIGYAAGPKPVIAAMDRVQSHTTSNATSISQWAALAALAVSQAELARRAGEFQARRDRIVAGLRRLSGFRCVTPEGSFYAFPNVRGRLGRDGLRTPTDLAERLLREARVAVIPGEAFGSDEHIRFSYAVSLERIEEGLARIERTLG